MNAVAYACTNLFFLSLMLLCLWLSETAAVGFPTVGKGLGPRTMIMTRVGTSIPRVFVHDVIASKSDSVFSRFFKGSPY